MDLSLKSTAYGSAFSFAWEKATCSLVDLMSSRGTQPAQPEKEVKKVSVLDTYVHNIPFSKRIHNALEAEGIKTVGDLVKCSGQHLRTYVPNIGYFGVREINEQLAKMGVQLSAPKSKPRARKRISQPSSFTRRNNEIYSLYMIHNVSQLEIAKKFNISAARVHQIVRKGEIERQKAFKAHPDALASAIQRAKSLSIPEWLKESPNESSDDQSSGAASA
jgi:predicted DNA-binding protein YlxM (UPF0122 family)